jgi:integrase
LASALSDRESGFTFDAGTLVLADYLDRWLEDSVKDSVKQRTFENYAYVVRLHLAPTLGHLKIKALSPANVQGLYRSKLNSGLSRRTVQLIHTTLHKALKQAVRWGLLPRNVTEAVTSPRPNKKEIHPLTPKEARTLLEAAKGERFEALYVLAVTAGLRRGELLGLRWTDVDLERGYVQVRQQLIRTRGGLTFTSPKGGKSRSVRLTTTAVKALQSHRERQLEEKLRLAGLWNESGLVFTTGIGTPMDGDNLVKRSFKPLMSRTLLPQIRFHDLRHTFATLLLSRGTHPKVVQEMLGHADISQTMDTYSHVLPDMQEEAVSEIEEGLF